MSASASSKYFLSSSGITGSGFSVSTTPSPLSLRVTMRFFLPQTSWSVCGKSSRVWPPRDSSRARAAFAIDSETISMLRRSMARCQPGLYCRWPSTTIALARSLKASISFRDWPSSSPVRMMPTRSFIDCWRSCWIV